MDSRWRTEQSLTRRCFLGRSGLGLGGLALASLLNGGLTAATARPHFRPRAKRVIFLFRSGGPSHIDLFDPKARLRQMQGKELPASVRGDLRASANTKRLDKLLLAGQVFEFVRCGRAGAGLAETLPWTGKTIDDIALVRSVHTDHVNHDPAVTFLLTGSLLQGRPTLGAWLSYGLGSLNRNLPEYVVLLSGEGGQPLRARYWGEGFLPSNHQGVPLRPSRAPVMCSADPPGVTRESRREWLDALGELNRMRQDATGDPEIAARIGSYEMAYRMQAQAPELMDISKEPKDVLQMYGAEPGKASFANNCLLARRLVERDVRFVQLCHRDWDHHTDLSAGLKRQCRETDRPVAALITDLKRRGLLDDTLVVWGGEFGRTAYCQGKTGGASLGRDHHPRCFTMWLAGGGIKRGLVLGKTDDFGFNV